MRSFSTTPPLRPVFSTTLLPPPQLLFHNSSTTTDRPQLPSACVISSPSSLSHFQAILPQVQDRIEGTRLQGRGPLVLIKRPPPTSFPSISSFSALCIARSFLTEGLDVESQSVWRPSHFCKVAFTPRAMPLSSDVSTVWSPNSEHLTSHLLQHTYYYLIDAGRGGTVGC